MVDFSDEFLIESKTARDEGLASLKAQNSEIRILNKAKLLIFAVWQGVGLISRQQLADFYEVSLDAIDKNYQRNKDEFVTDGVKVLQSKELTEVRDILSLTSSTPKETVYTSAGVLRMGFILRDSQVARAVRTTTIKFIQGIGSQINSQMILKTLLDSYPSLSSLVRGNSLQISSPYAPYWDKMKTAMKRKYPNGGILGMTTDDIRKAIQFCSTYTNNFKLQGIKELKREIAGQVRGQYPALTSDVFSFNSEDENGRIVFMFQFQDLVIDLDYVETCVGRGYIQTAKNDLGVDRAYLIFVAPFGATSYAQDYINRHLVSDYKGCVGVLMVKELADILYNQAYNLRNLGTARGEVTKEFSRLRSYDFPEPPALYDQLELDFLNEQE